jgi:putative endonuclease
MGKDSKHIGDTKCIGDWGEDLACAYLIKRRYEILTRNFSCHFGEIDIVCRKDGEIVFVEVKTRRRISTVRPEESVGYAKRGRLIRTALYFLKVNNFLEEPCRFDIAAVSIGTHRSPRIRLTKDCIWELGGGCSC